MVKIYLILRLIVVLPILLKRKAQKAVYYFYCSIIVCFKIGVFKLDTRTLVSMLIILITFVRVSKIVPQHHFHELITEIKISTQNIPTHSR